MARKLEAGHTHFVLESQRYRRCVGCQKCRRVLRSALHVWVGRELNFRSAYSPVVALEQSSWEEELDLDSPSWVKNQSGTLVIAACTAGNAGVLRCSTCMGDAPSHHHTPARVGVMLMQLKAVRAKHSLPL